MTEPMTEKEAVLWFVKKLQQDVANWVCPFCGADILRQDQVVRSVYAHPCGHRLYQGIAKGERPENLETNTKGDSSLPDYHRPHQE